MLQKERTSLKFHDIKVDQLNQIATAFDNTFVVDANFQRPEESMSTTRKIIHQTAEGKELLQLYNRGTREKLVFQSFKMMNDREVMIFLTNYKEVDIQIINLQSKQLSMSFLDKMIFKQKISNQQHWTLKAVYMFPQTQIVSLVIWEFRQGYTRVLYYKYDKLQEGKAEPVKQYTFKDKNVKVNKVDDSSKMAVWKLDGSTITFLTFLNQKEEITTLKNIRCSWFDSKQHENANKEESYKIELIECRPDYYFLKIYCLVKYSIVDRKFGFLDTSNQAQISKKLLVQTEGIKQVPMYLQPLKNTIVFYDWFRKCAHQVTFPTYFFDYQQQTMVATDHQEAGVECLSERFFFPNWDKNTIVRAQQKSQPADEIGVTVTRVVSRFTLKEVSMHMLLHLNEHFDDDLLQDAIQMLCEI